MKSEDKLLALYLVLIFLCAISSGNPEPTTVSYYYATR